MQVESKFYEHLHTKDDTYGRSRYNVARLLGLGPFRSWFSSTAQRPVRVLDIGCGKGQFLLDLTQALQSSQVKLAGVAALDLIKTTNNRLGEVSPRPEFFQQTVDGQKLPFENGSFELICCNHVLEHVFQTEFFLREIRRVLHKNGLAVVAVPNCAAWMNRIAFLVGGQPLGSEVGTESITYGFWPKALQSRLKQFDPSGHIRDFTPRSLADLTSACGFKPVGWWAQNGGFLSGLLPTLTRNLGIVLQPAPDR